MRRTLILAVATGFTLLALLASSIALASGSTPRVATVVGSFRLLAGASPGLNELVPGTVTFSPTGANHHHAVVVVVGTSGTFASHLGAGRWIVVGRTPRADGGRIACGGFVLTVPSASRVRVDVTCNLP